jgi:hypothetical protein
MCASLQVLAESHGRGLKSHPIFDDRTLLKRNIRGLKSLLSLCLLKERPPEVRTISPDEAYPGLTWIGPPTIKWD